MDKKLTLSLNQEIIAKAKLYAKTNRTSLSKLIENYLSSLSSMELTTNQNETSALVDSLCGIIQLPENIDLKQERSKYLMEKYK